MTLISLPRGSVCVPESVCLSVSRVFTVHLPSKVYLLVCGTLLDPTACSISLHGHRILTFYPFFISVCVCVLLLWCETWPCNVNNVILGSMNTIYQHHNKHQWNKWISGPCCGEDLMLSTHKPLCLTLSCFLHPPPNMQPRKWEKGRRSTQKGATASRGHAVNEILSISMPRIYFRARLKVVLCIDYRVLSVSIDIRLVSKQKHMDNGVVDVLIVVRGREGHRFAIQILGKLLCSKIQNKIKPFTTIHTQTKVSTMSGAVKVRCLSQRLLRHSARRKQGSNQQPSGYKSPRSTSWAKQTQKALLNVSYDTRHLALSGRKRCVRS